MPRRVPELVQEVVVIVAADQVVRNRNADGRRDRQVRHRALREAFESMPHQRYHPRQPLDDVRRLDVDHPQSGIGLLVLDDHAQGGVELLARGQVRRSPRRRRARSTAAPTPRSRRADPASRRTSDRGSAAKPRPAVRPRRGSASSCRCGRAPRRWRPGCADASSCRPRLTASSIGIALQIFVEMSR